jgi:cold shock CspA family protein
MHEGTIVRVRVDRGFGFIATPDQPDAFFHAKDVADELLPFDERLQEMRVRFDVIGTDKGPRAKNVRAAI